MKKEQIVDLITEAEQEIKAFERTSNKTTLKLIDALKEAINYTRCSTELPVEDAKLLYSLLPEWAKNAPSGLDPTLYGTLTQEGDQAIVNKVNTILKKAIT